MMHPGRPLAVAVIATALAAAVGALLLPAAVPAGPGFASLLTAGCAVAGCVATTWLWTLAVLVVLDALRGRTARGGVPRVVRRVVLAACGLSLTGTLAAPAYADTGTPPARPSTQALAGLQLPDRTTTTTQGLGALSTTDRHHHAEPAGESLPPESVEVSPGDTLWGLAARSLGYDPSAAEVERRWREIYAANRDVVGADPDLIRPGQRLLLPGSTTDTSDRS